MFQGHDEAPLRQVGIGQVIERAHHRHGRNSVALQQLGRLLGRPGRRPLGDALVDDVPSRQPAVEGGRGRVEGPSEGVAQSLPGGVVENRQGQPPVLPGGGVHAVGHGVIAPVAPSGRVHSVEIAVEIHVPHEEGGGVGLGHVHQLTLAGAAPVVQGGENPDGEELARDVIRVVQRGAAGIRDVGMVPQAVQTDETEIEGSVGRHLVEGTAAAVPLGRDVDDRRVGLFYRLVPEAHSVENTTPVVLGDHVGPRAQPKSQLPALVGLEVEHDAAAAATLGVEGEGAVHPIPSGRRGERPGGRRIRS